MSKRISSSPPDVTSIAPLCWALIGHHLVPRDVAAWSCASRSTCEMLARLPKIVGIKQTPPPIRMWLRRADYRRHGLSFLFSSVPKWPDDLGEAHRDTFSSRASLGHGPIIKCIDLNFADAFRWLFRKRFPFLNTNMWGVQAVVRHALHVGQPFVLEQFTDEDIMFAYRHTYEDLLPGCAHAGRIPLALKALAKLNATDREHQELVPWVVAKVQNKKLLDAVWETFLPGDKFTTANNVFTECAKSGYNDGIIKALQTKEVHYGIVVLEAPHILARDDVDMMVRLAEYVAESIGTLITDIFVNLCRKRAVRCAHALFSLYDKDVCEQRDIIKECLMIFRHNEFDSIPILACLMERVDTIMDSDLADYVLRLAAKAEDDAVFATLTNPDVLTYRRLGAFNVLEQSTPPVAVVEFKRLLRLVEPLSANDMDGLTDKLIQKECVDHLRCLMERPQFSEYFAAETTNLARLAFRRRAPESLALFFDSGLVTPSGLHDLATEYGTDHVFAKVRDVVIAHQT